ncbi:MAG: PKD domain-containing protein, partial [Planctomycetes bacterium]|nr:PKD domain-containing protein [Planctomycetota bacterium]
NILPHSSTSYGKGLRKQINDIENPFSGPDDMFISIYKGQIFCPETGDYGFATDSDDASFLLINGQLVAEFPGGHIPDQNWSHAGKKTLKRGVHEIVYYLVESYGGQLARAGWKKPSDQEYSLIPPHAFIRELPCEILGIQERQKPINAYFVAEERTALKINNKFLFPTFAFEDRSSSSLGKIQSYAWDFGDGTRGATRNPTHRFLDAGKYRVSLTVTDNLGYSDTVSREVTVEAVDVTNFSVLFDIQTAENVIYPIEDVVLTLRLRSTATSNLPVTLSAKRTASAGFSIQDEAEALTLEPGVFKTVVKRYKGRTGGCDVHLALAYQGKTVAERTVRIVQTSDALKGISVENENLVDEQGNLVILKVARVAADPKRKKKPDAIRKIVVVDDSLSPMVTKGNEGATYYGMLKQMLARESGEDGIELVRAGTSTDLSGYPPLVRLSKIHSEVVTQKPDLVLLACSITDILNYLPIDKFERYLTAAVDQILSQSEAEVMLIAPPPLIINPEISKAYALIVKKVGLEKGLRVADMYTTFLLREGGLVSLYKDEMEQDPVYYSYPNRKGQELIARELYRKMFGRS